MNAHISYEAHTAGTYLRSTYMKHLGVQLPHHPPPPLLREWMLVHRRFTPDSISPVAIYTPG